MEFSLTAMALGMFTWAFYKKHKKQKEDQKKHRLERLIAQESDKIMEQISQYKRVKLTLPKEKQKDLDDSNLIPQEESQQEEIFIFKPKTALDEVLEEKFNEQKYVLNEDIFYSQHQPLIDLKQKKKRKFDVSQQNKDFSFTSQLDKKEIKRIRKYSKFNPGSFIDENTSDKNSLVSYQKSDDEFQKNLKLPNNQLENKLQSIEQTEIKLTNDNQDIQLNEKEEQSQPKATNLFDNLIKQKQSPKQVDGTQQFQFTTQLQGQNLTNPNVDIQEIQQQQSQEIQQQPPKEQKTDQADLKTSSSPSNLFAALINPKPSIQQNSINQFQNQNFDITKQNEPQNISNQQLGINIPKLNDQKQQFQLFDQKAGLDNTKTNLQQNTIGLFSNIVDEKTNLSQNQNQFGLFQNQDKDDKSISNQQQNKYNFSFGMFNDQTSNQQAKGSLFGNLLSTNPPVQNQQQSGAQLSLNLNFPSTQQNQQQIQFSSTDATKQPVLQYTQQQDQKVQGENSVTLCNPQFSLPTNSLFGNLLTNSSNLGNGNFGTGLFGN